MIDIYERVKSDYYKTKVPYSIPSPPVLSQSTSDQRKDQIRLHNLDQARLIEEFKKDLLEHAGAMGHPKADLCFKLAWEHGHSSGFHEVISYFDEIVELIQ